MDHVRAWELVSSAMAALIAAAWLSRKTRHAMNASTAQAFRIVDLEFSWNGQFFRSLVGPMSDSQRVQLATAHWIDSAFAVAYSVALGSALLALESSQCAPELLWTFFAALGFSAGGFDVLENLCLQRCLRDRSLVAGNSSGSSSLQKSDTLDGPLRLAAIAASIKFVFATIAISAISYGLLRCLIDGLLGSYQHYLSPLMHE